MKDIQYFTASGTYTKPTPESECLRVVVCIGGGGKRSIPKLIVHNIALERKQLKEKYMFKKKKPMPKPGNGGKKC